jgi:hypothetical protein
MKAQYYLMLLIATAGGPANAETLICSFEQKQICNGGRPCESIPIGKNWTAVWIDRNKIARCEGEKCDFYDMTASGDYKGFRTFEAPSRGMFIKIGPDGAAMEVASLATMAVISHGRCVKGDGPSKRQ